MEEKKMDAFNSLPTSQGLRGVSGREGAHMDRGGLDKYKTHPSRVFAVAIDLHSAFFIPTRIVSFHSFPIVGCISRSQARPEVPCPPFSGEPISGNWPVP